MPTPRPAPISAPIARLPNTMPAMAPSAVPHSRPAGIAIMPHHGKPARGGLVASFTAHSWAQMPKASKLLNDQIALRRLAQGLVIVLRSVGGPDQGLSVVFCLGILWV